MMPHCCAISLFCYGFWFLLFGLLIDMFWFFDSFNISHYDVNEIDKQHLCISLDFYLTHFRLFVTNSQAHADTFTICLCFAFISSYFFQNSRFLLCRNVLQIFGGKLLAIQLFLSFLPTLFSLCTRLRNVVFVSLITHFLYLCYSCLCFAHNRIHAQTHTQRVYTTFPSLGALDSTLFSFAIRLITFVLFLFFL